MTDKAKPPNRHYIKRLKECDRVVIPAGKPEPQATRDCPECGKSCVITETSVFVCEPCQILFA